MYRDLLIEDFTSPKFTESFKIYFDELEIKVSKWNELFLEMNNDKNQKNYAFLRLDAEDNTVGFIQFGIIEFKSWFFEGKAGFIREFWIREGFRGEGHGSELILKAEDYFKEKNIRTSILTTDQADGFYLKHGYIKRDDIKAINQDRVYTKELY